MIGVVLRAVMALVVGITSINGPIRTDGPLELAPAVRLNHPNPNAMPVHDLPGWKLVFNESFSNDVPLGQFEQKMTRWNAYDENWHDTNGAGGVGNGTYSPSRVLSVEHGILNAHLHTENGQHLIATFYPKAMAAQKYGRMAIRWRADDELQGYMVLPSLINPVDGRATSGEIDHPEMTLANNGGRSFIHYRDKKPITAEPFRYFLDPTVWHTSVVEWSPGLVVLIIDGVEIGRSRDDAQVMNMPARWVTQITTLVTGKPAPFGAPADETQGNVQFDWAAYWALAA